MRFHTTSSRRQTPRLSLRKQPRNMRFSAAARSYVVSTAHTLPLGGFCCRGRQDVGGVIISSQQNFARTQMRLDQVLMAGTASVDLYSSLLRIMFGECFRAVCNRRQCGWYLVQVHRHITTSTSINRTRICGRRTKMQRTGERVSRFTDPPAHTWVCFQDWKNTSMYTDSCITS